MKSLTGALLLVLSCSLTAQAKPALTKESLNSGVHACSNYTKQQLTSKASYQYGVNCQVLSLSYGAPQDSNVFEMGAGTTIGAVRVDGQLTLNCGSQKTTYKFQQITPYEGSTFSCNLKPSSPLGY